MTNTESSNALRIAERVVNTDYADLPVEVVSKAKLCILDSVGVMTAAAKQKSSLVLHDYVARTSACTSGASIFGFGTQAPLQQAVQVNASMLHSLELEDHHSHQRSLNHPGVTAIPTGLAYAEAGQLGGKQLLLGTSGRAVPVERLHAFLAVPQID